MKRVIFFAILVFLTCFIQIGIILAEEGPISIERDAATGEIISFSYHIKGTEGHGIRYRTDAIIFTITTKEGASYPVQFTGAEMAEIYGDDIMKLKTFEGDIVIEISDIAKKIPNARELVNRVDREGGKIASSAIIGIYRLHDNGGRTLLNNIYSVGEVDTIARDKYGFGNRSLGEMRGYFNDDLLDDKPKPVIIDLIANRYIGQLNVLEGTSSLQVGVNVTNTSNIDYNNVEFKIDLTGAQNKSKTFTRNIPRDSNANYADTIMCNPIEPDKTYNIAITVNPGKNNPDNEIRYDNNRVQASVEAIQPPPPQNPNEGNLDLILRFKEMQDYTLDDQWGSGSNSITVKSGYGISIAGEITNFTYPGPKNPPEPPEPAEYIGRSRAYNYRIDSSSAKLLTNSYSNYLPFITGPNGALKYTDDFITMITNSRLKARFYLKQSAFPSGSKRRIYTLPQQEDNTYEAIVSANAVVTWDEMWRWVGYEHAHGNEKDGYTYHRHSGTIHRTVTEAFNNRQAKGTIIVNGSMFDDDQQVIKK